MLILDKRHGMLTLSGAPSTTSLIGYYEVRSIVQGQNNSVDNIY